MGRDLNQIKTSKELGPQGWGKTVGGNFKRKNRERNRP